MLYGGPLGTYLSGYYGPGSSKSGSPGFTNTGSGPSTASSYSRPRTGRYRTPSAYGVTSSGTTATASRTSPISSRSSFYTPQTRRKYSDESTESPVVNRSRYTTSSGAPLNHNSINTSGSSTTGSSGYYSRPSPSYSSSSSASTVLSPSSTITPSSTTAALVSPPPSSYARAATLSPYGSVPRRAQSQNRSRRLNESLYFPHFRFAQAAVGANLDYKRLYEAEKSDNQELKNQIEKAQTELRELRDKIDEARRFPSQQLQKSAQWFNPNDADQRVLEELRATSEKLKAEHRALTRVISRLM